MRAINIPTFKFKLVFDTCVNSISNDNLRNKFIASSVELINDCKSYHNKAKNAELFLIDANNCQNDQVVITTITKKELKNLYNQQMIGQNKPARTIYDKLIISAPNGICPYCGFGQTSSLDHYLPKASFPNFSVLPLNLIPSCNDCNTGKHAKITNTAEQQVIHPYYDHQLIQDQKWLFAKVIETIPASIQFFVQPPEDWSNIMQQRVQSHFNEFNLSKRYSIEAANELSTLNPTLSNYFSTNKNLVKLHLRSAANAMYSNHKNSWKTAMYHALVSSDWYCDGAFTK